ncbi:MAG: tetratricopeptide repeat protein [Proteobacteria bacterium]|nr:tetratricopeptide repeat protein [Pseudomonadota bacterium]
MKDFFERYPTRIEVEDLRRFAKVVIDDLGPVLDGYEFVVRLLDSEESRGDLSPEMKGALMNGKVHVEAETGRVHLPVVFDGAPLGLITAVPPAGQSMPKGGTFFLPLAIRLSLEKILMYKINITDRETGLNNEDYFRTYLGRRLAETGGAAGGRTRLKPLHLGDAGEPAELTVLLAEIKRFDQLAAGHGRLEAARTIQVLAGWLRDAAPSSYCLARLDRGRIGLVLPRQSLETALECARKVAARTREKEGCAVRFQLVLGLAAYPADLGDEEELDENGSEGLVDLMIGKAEQALNHALNQKEESIFTFADVLLRGGRVLQELAYNRVVVNLGRLAGAREGQAFVLHEGDKTEPVDYKGEVVLFDVREDYAMGEVIQLASSLNRVKPGDMLVLSRASGEAPAVGHRPAEESRDPLLGIPDHQGFVHLLSEKSAREDRFAVMLVRVDGYDRYRTTMGRFESDRHMLSLLELLRELLPEEALVGRFSLESLAVYLPGREADRASTLAREARDRIAGRLRQTSSFGLAVHPSPPFGPEDVLTNAQKALEHASFLGPSSTAAFDSVSLNISGDKLFESGDLAGAIKEYNLALRLDSRDLNVLNSLGVCYGQQGRTDLALETFDRVIEIEPRDLMAHYNRGFVEAMSGRSEAALTSFRRAVEIDGGNFNVLFQLGKTALALDLIDEAVSSFRRASALEDRRSVVYRFLGQALLRSGRPDEAVEAFKAAARYDPYDAPSLSQLGVLYMDQGANLDVALSLTRQSVEQDRTNSLFRQRLARALSLAGDLDRAETEYRRALDMGACSREVYYELGLVVRDQGRLDEARDWFDRSLDRDGQFQPARTALEELNHPGPRE